MQPMQYSKVLSSAITLFGKRRMLKLKVFVRINIKVLLVVIRQGALTVDVLRKNGYRQIQTP